ncbi:preprotein translocase subunit SecE [Serpentinicella alkaliphila]|uniref:Protein translocase subunit SecE n=1 Tax=Serpentinicella alkaliphila TaxID=1734049 RepID=A0A4R2SZD2_9FIRM|nr:preprotein translocase subunit SecE [Serpentinicella alkaliphila]QUH25425.1 preprotein translocase subunit SecE [Serpentinicella alkaliphila]TCP95929.1 preprotein translocase subunit SecE [Serpentinicella alkaliphila]
MSTQANTNNKAGLGKYFKGVKSELKKVIWPNKKELSNHTGVVIVTCVIATAIIWILDTVFGSGLGLIIK